jgi:hypothetical protein
VTAASFEGVHEKIARAEHHFEKLYGAFKEFVEREPQPFGISIPYFEEHRAAAPLRPRER